VLEPQRPGPPQLRLRGRRRAHALAPVRRKRKRFVVLAPDKKGTGCCAPKEEALRVSSSWQKGMAKKAFWCPDLVKENSPAPKGAAALRPRAAAADAPRARALHRYISRYMGKEFEALSAGGRKARAGRARRCEGAGAYGFRSPGPGFLAGGPL
jgi:hypothetical protein